MTPRRPSRLLGFAVLLAAAMIARRVTSLRSSRDGVSRDRDRPALSRCALGVRPFTGVNANTSR
jgi:hypothetical protein